MLARTLKKLEPAMSTYQRMALEKQIRLMLKWKGIRVRGANAFLAKI
jgi:hypothetical protein